jgi:hypothetical protein
MCKYLVFRQIATTLAYQVDPNWKLLGIKNNPAEVPYHEVGYADESRDNAGLGLVTESINLHKRTQYCTLIVSIALKGQF